MLVLADEPLASGVRAGVPADSEDDARLNQAADMVKEQSSVADKKKLSVTSCWCQKQHRPP